MSGRVIIALIVAASSSVACGSDDTTPSAPSAHAALTINTISPADGSSVSASQPLNVSASLHYDLATATIGHITALVTQFFDFDAIDPGTHFPVTTRAGDVSIQLTEPPPTGGRGPLVLRFTLIRDDTGNVVAQREVSYNVTP